MRGYERWRTTLDLFDAAARDIPSQGPAEPLQSAPAPSILAAGVVEQDGREDAAEQVRADFPEAVAFARSLREVFGDGVKLTYARNARGDELGARGSQAVSNAAE